MSILDAAVSNKSETLLSVNNLTKSFQSSSGMFSRNKSIVKAVDNVSFNVAKGKTMGLVGESGSGKTTIGKCIVRLLEPTEGEVWFDGQDITQLKRKAMQRKRSDVQMIYQSPAASLNSRMTIGQIIAEPLWIHQNMRAYQAQQRVLELLDVVGLKEEHFHRFPHEFSGGQQQRVGIARALAVNPKLIILDEPTSALDVSVQAQVLNLLQELQDQFDLTYIFISHDLSVVRYLCDEVALLYLGKIVEIADVDTIFEAPQHPYTQALISAIPEPNPEEQREQIILKGDSTMARPLKGCPFAPRCHAPKVDSCETMEPNLISIKTNDSPHKVACHLMQEVE